MTYIQPTGDIILCHVENYTQDLSDAPLFKTKDEQYKWFYSKRILVLNNQSYTRRSSNTLRIQSTIGKIYNANYVMFRNESFENHWYYAFVTNIEYVSNNVCNVFFSVDPIQTWFTLDQASLGECYVLREHVANDTIGVNLEPEPVETGEMMAEPNSYNHISSNYCEPIIMVATTESHSSHDGKGVRINNTYSGCTLQAWDFDNIAHINSFIKQYSFVGKPDAVVGVWMAPRGAIGGASNDGRYDGEIIDNVDKSLTMISECTELNKDSGFRYTSGGSIYLYKPHNNKLYTYPYTFYRVMTGQGNYADYRYEFFPEVFHSSTAGYMPVFRIIGNALQPVSVVCTPVNYKGHICKNYKMPNGAIITEDMPYWAESISVTGYPQCSWNNDTYAAWMAQNSVPMSNTRHALEATNGNSLRTVYAQNANRKLSTDIDTATDWISGLSSLLLAGNLGALPGAALSTIDKSTSTYLGNKNAELSMQNAIDNSEINLITTQQNAMYKSSMLANTEGGTINSGSCTLGDKSNNFGIALSFFGFRMMPNITRLKKIDKYFDMFGYSVNTVKVPNITSRPNWNYVKTVNANVKGNMPASDKENIKELLDRGIRFWKNPDAIGNYELDNTQK